MLLQGRFHPRDGAMTHSEEPGTVPGARCLRPATPEGAAARSGGTFLET